MTPFEMGFGVTVGVVCAVGVVCVVTVVLVCIAACIVTVIDWAWTALTRPWRRS